MTFFVQCLDRVADAGTPSQYTHVEVERRVNSATGARGSTLRREIGPGLTSKTNQVRNLLRMSARTWKLITFAVPVKGLDDKKIVQIASGQQHSIALDEDGYAPSSNLGKDELTVFPSQHCIRLGLQWLLSSGPWESKRRFNSTGCPSGMSCPLPYAAVLMWCLQFAGPHKQFLGAKVVAGPTNSVVIDRQSMYYMAGKVRFRSRSPLLRTDSANYSGRTPVMVSIPGSAMFLVTDGLKARLVNRIRLSDLCRISWGVR
jgi:hypothetical protein